MTWEELIERLEAVRKYRISKRDEARPINLPARKINALECVHYAHNMQLEEHPDTAASMNNHLTRFLEWQAKKWHYRGCTASHTLTHARTCARMYAINKHHLRHVFCSF